MSCPTSNAPIDISMSKITGKCDLKCSFSFHYNNSSCVATNRGDYISISYDKSSNPPVVYNATNYDVQEIRLYYPSLHSFNGSKYDAELVIIHYSNSGSAPLLVCIPIRKNNSNSLSATFFKTLVDTMSSSSPSEGEISTINFPKFNLSLFIPKKPFFSYSATEPYQPCSENVDYIVFNDALDITDETLKTLQDFIESNPYDVKTGPNLFYNEKGPNLSGSSNGEIYIDCQPVGQSDELTEVVTYSDNVSFSFSDLLKNPFIKLLVASIIFIVILFLVKYALNTVKPTKNIINIMKK